MCTLLNKLIEDICESLTGLRDAEHNIVRVHTRKLQELGDLSFPLDTKSWFKFVNKTHIENKNVIFDCKLTKDELIEASKQWELSIDNIAIKEGNVVLYLNRQKAFKAVVNTAIQQAANFGTFAPKFNKVVCIPQSSIDLSKINLTELKIHLVQNVTSNILSFIGCDVSKKVLQNSLTLAFVTSGGKNCVTCGPVLNELGTKNINTTAEQFYSKRTVDMRLMAEHKYGVRTTSLPGWKEFFQKLGEAAVAVHLLQNKPQHTTVVKLDDSTSSSVKGASFILYNCARLATLLKEFDKKVDSSIYPPLPELQNVEFNLLVEPEEWELLFVYILRFPTVIKSCINQVDKYQIAPHFLVLHLSGLASTFSVYYRRVRILTEPREHLFPVLHQRIYLLKALQHVFHNSLRLLDIEPVKQM